MTQDEIIRMVYEAGGVKGEHTVLNHTWFELTAEDLERFAALVAAHEREKCAKTCEKYPDQHGNFFAVVLRGIDKQQQFTWPDSATSLNQGDK